MLLRPFVAVGMNLIRVSARGRLGFGARLSPGDAFGLSFHTIGIADDEAAFVVFRIRLQIQYAAGDIFGAV